MTGVNSVLAARAAAYGNIAGVNNFFAFDGDSRTSGVTSTWVGTIMPNITGWSVNRGVSGSILIPIAGSARADMKSRLSSLIQILPAAKNGRKFYAVIGPMGANDLPVVLEQSPVGVNQTTAATAYANAMATQIVDPLFNAGFDGVVLCTELPTELPLDNATKPEHNATRNILNNIYRTAWPGAHALTAIIDFAADSIMGPDNSWSVNPTYWAGDQFHPSATGYARMATIAQPVLTALP